MQQNSLQCAILQQKAAMPKQSCLALKYWITGIVIEATGLVHCLHC